MNFSLEVGLITSETGIGPVVAAAGYATSVDSFHTGLRSLWDRKNYPTTTEMCLDSLNVPGPVRPALPLVTALATRKFSSASIFPERAGLQPLEAEVGSATKVAEKVHGHYSFPKALGGHPDQRLSDIIESMHTGKGGIHSDLASFEGGWLRPKKGMMGAQIVEKYGQDDVVEGLRRFYSQDKWSHLAKDFEDAVDFTNKMSK